MPDQELPITAVIAVLNEAVNIATCLQSLDFVERIVVIDSGSTDGTVEIAEANRAEVVQFHYEGGYPKKRQWALDTVSIETEWVLLLDADESVTPELQQAIKEVIAANEFDAFSISKGFHFMGRRFRFGGFSHSAVLLFKKGTARFEKLIDESAKALDMEVHERLVVQGKVGKISPPLIHEDFKGLEAYIDRHNKYSTWEARVRSGYMGGLNENSETSVRPNLFGGLQERRRFLKLLAMRLPCEHWLWFFYHYLARLGFLEGVPGLIASRIRRNYISDVNAKVYELKQRDL